MSDYNVFQQVFSLSVFSNAVGGVKGTQDDIQSAFEAVLPGTLKKLGNWEVVWGPVVWKNDPSDASSGPDNAWYMARCPSLTFEDGSKKEAYVVAVAGTATAYDWLEENFQVGTVVDFNLWVAGGITVAPVPVQNVSDSGTYLAFGTARAVHTLLTVVAPQSAAGAGTTLFDFIQTLSASSARPSKVIFSGHSLGGALSPTLSVALVQGGAFSGHLTAQDVLVYPTAGPSPGNGKFSELYSSIFPPTIGEGYKVWNRNVINILDIVPQAWSTDPKISPEQNLQNIPSIYGLPPILAVSLITLMFANLAKSSGTVYVPLPNAIFSGSPPATAPTGVPEFLAVALDQHMNAYIKFFDIDFSFIPVLASRRGISTKKGDEVLLTYVVIHDILLRYKNAQAYGVKTAVQT